MRAGSVAELECVATGNPPPSLHWRRLQPDQRHQVLHTSLHSTDEVEFFYLFESISLQCLGNSAGEHNITSGDFNRRLLFSSSLKLYLFESRERFWLKLNQTTIKGSDIKDDQGISSNSPVFIISNNIVKTFNNIEF